jgi:hypothetical protein
MEIWLASGHFEDRGRGSGKYVMARNGDAGPYSQLNVSICLFEQNVKDAYVNVPEKCAPAVRTGNGQGWTFVARLKKPYQVMFLGKYVGIFSTEQEAVEAYAAAASFHRLSKQATKI